MINAVASELYKIRKNKILYVCTALVLLAAIWLVYKDSIVTTPPDKFVDWLRSAYILSTIVMTAASGFFITSLMQKEYADKTIINVLCAPTSRTVFILSKLVVWLLWYVLTLFFTLLIYYAGANLLFAGQIHAEEIRLLLQMIALPRLISFVACTPLLLVGVVQTHNFYPSLMVSLGFLCMEIFTIVLPLKVSSLIPWCVGTLYAFGMPREYGLRCTIVVILCFCLSVVSAYRIFKRQNQ